MIYSLISLTISPYTPQGVYCQIYPLLEGNPVKFNFNIQYLRMIYWMDWKDYTKGHREKGQRDKGTKGQRDKGTKGQREKGPG